jgi:hypothetical protein
MSTCPGCAQQRYPDEPWTDEDHGLYQILAEGLRQVFTEPDGSIRFGPLIPDEPLRHIYTGVGDYPEWPVS